MNLEAEIHRGNRLANGESIVWRGRPGWFGLACDAFHLRAIACYFAFIIALNAYQAWAKHLAFDKAARASLPLLVAIAGAMFVVAGLAWLTARTTRYTITDRRVILHYGVAMPATLSLPYSQIVKASVAINRDHSGDIPLVLKSTNHMPYLKLWPLARPWTITHPEPMLRRVPKAAVAGGLLVRAIAAAAHEAESLRAAATVPEVETIAHEPTVAFAQAVA